MKFSILGSTCSICFFDRPLVLYKIGVFVLNLMHIFLVTYEMHVYVCIAQDSRFSALLNAGAKTLVDVGAKARRPNTQQGRFKHLLLEQLFLNMDFPSTTPLTSSWQGF